MSDDDYDDNGHVSAHRPIVVKILLFVSNPMERDSYRYIESYLHVNFRI